MGSGCANNQVTAVGDRLPSGKSVESRFKARGQRICRAIGSEKWSEIVSLCKLEGGTDIKRRSRSQFHFLAWSLFLFLRFFSSPTYLVRLIFETSGIFCSRDLSILVKERVGSSGNYLGKGVILRFFDEVDFRDRSRGKNFFG